MTTKVKAPDYADLAEALRTMTHAYDARTVRDGLKMIGLCHKVTFPGAKIKTTDDARRVLIQLEEALGETERAERLWDQMDEWGER